jgi:nitrite reductase (NO-forming)
MKKKIYLLGLGLTTLLMACGGGEQPKAVEEKTAPVIQEVVEEPVVEETAAPAIDPAIMTKGEEIYAQCAACHQPTGEGIPGAFPPLAGSDYMLADIDRAIQTVLRGTDHPITVNGVEYPGKTMTKFEHLSDEDVAAVATYVFNSWGNSMGLVTAEMVAKQR